MNIEQQLQATAERWLAEEALSPERADRLEALVRGKGRRRWLLRLGTVASVAAIAGMALTWPVMISMASEVPLVGPFITRMASYDDGAAWAGEKGFVVPVGKSATDQGYTVRADSVVADALRTIVYFTIEGPNLDQSMPSLDITAKYNWVSAPSDGYGSMRWEFVNGQMVGQVNLAPLPHPVALVEVALDSINGVKGDWSVSFLASRTALDQYTRIVDVNQHIQGEGYDFIVQRVILAPTETRVEMGGPVAGNLALGPVELLANGKPLARHGGSHGITHFTDAPQMKFDLPFERVGGDTNSLTLRLQGVKQWLAGGPVIDLTKPGSRVEYDGVTFELASLAVVGGRTEVALRVPVNQSLRDRAWQDFGVGEWVLVDADGRQYRPKEGRGPSELDPTIRFSFPAEVQAPVRLESRKHAEPVSGAVELLIPLK